jgi:hypothetical protein
MRLRRIVVAVLGVSLLSIGFSAKADAGRHRCPKPSHVVQCWRSP